MEHNRILRLPEVLQLTGWSASSLYRSVKRGAFPPQVVLGANSVGWRLHDVMAWIENRPVTHAAEARKGRQVGQRVIAAHCRSPCTWAGKPRPRHHGLLGHRDGNGREADGTGNQLTAARLTS